ncbi:hypothetical protein Hanom_Chr12g01132681 [Helianthus anomalus]
MEVDNTPADAATNTETDVNMQDASGAENGVPATGDNPVQMETDVKVSETHAISLHIKLWLQKVPYGCGLF